MKKILLVSGCSNTDENFYSVIHPDIDTSYPKWPELLAQKLNMDCVNLAKSGAGNDYIYTTLFNYITNNNTSNIGLVIPAWSQCQRKDYQEGNMGRWTNTGIDPHGDVFSWVKKSLVNFLSFQILCEKYNLNYLHLHMLDLYINIFWGLKPRDVDIDQGLYSENFRFNYKLGDKEKDNKKVIDIILSYEKLINTKKFIGWPLCEELGGFSLQRKLIELEPNLMLSKKDSHPNKLGHERLAEFIEDYLNLFDKSMQKEQGN